jgi:hypothetical protein
VAALPEHRLRTAFAAVGAPPPRPPHMPARARARSLCGPHPTNTSLSAPSPSATLAAHGGELGEAAVHALLDDLCSAGGAGTGEAVEPALAATVFAQMDKRGAPPPHTHPHPPPAGPGTAAQPAATRPPARHPAGIQRCARGRARPPSLGAAGAGSVGFAAFGGFFGAVALPLTPGTPAKTSSQLARGDAAPAPLQL